MSLRKIAWQFNLQTMLEKSLFSSSNCFVACFAQNATPFNACKKYLRELERSKNCCAFSLLRTNHNFPHVMQYFLNYKYFEFLNTQKMEEFLVGNWMKNCIFKLKVKFHPNSWSNFSSSMLSFTTIYDSVAFSCSLPSSANSRRRRFLLRTLELDTPGTRELESGIDRLSRVALRVTCGFPQLLT